METKTHIFFYGHTPNKCGFNVFSQWFPATFVEEIGPMTITYANTEQYMMAHKAVLFGDIDTVEKIMSTNDPAKIKALGRVVKNFDAAIWNENKFDIVIKGNYLKFSQNESLLKTLLETKNKTIVEASPSDKVWGCGLRADVAAKVPESEWPGSNLLGLALVEVRSELRKIE